MGRISSVGVAMRGNSAAMSWDQCSNVGGLPFCVSSWLSLVTPLGKSRSVCYVFWGTYRAQRLFLIVVFGEENASCILAEDRTVVKPQHLSQQPLAAIPMPVSPRICKVRGSLRRTEVKRALLSRCLVFDT